MNPHFDISAQVEKKNFRPGPRDVVLYARQEEGEEEEEEEEERDDEDRKETEDKKQR